MVEPYNIRPFVLLKRLCCDVSIALRIKLKTLFAIVSIGARIHL